MVKIKRVSHRKTTNRASVKATKINKQLMQGRVITNKPIARQSREQITSMKQYQDLLKILK